VEKLKQLNQANTGGCQISYGAEGDDFGWNEQSKTETIKGKHVEIDPFSKKGKQTETFRHISHGRYQEN